jgi:hypothetical protein
MATDQELRERILRRLYKVRHNNPPHIMLPDGLNMRDLDENTLLGILNQLKERGWVKWGRIAGGLVKGRLQITDAGIQEIEDMDRVVIPPEEIAAEPAAPAAHPTHTLVIWITFAFGVFVVLASIVLFLLGATGQTDITFFGNKLSSQSVGVVGFFFGAVLVGVTLRRIITSVERLSSK